MPLIPCNAQDFLTLAGADFRCALPLRSPGPRVPENPGGHECV